MHRHGLRVWINYSHHLAASGEQKADFPLKIPGGFRRGNNLDGKFRSTEEVSARCHFAHALRL